MYLPDRVYPDLKAGGQGISLSLKKIVDFFAGKVGTNSPQATSSSSSPIKLSSRMVGKAYMLYILRSFLFPTKKGTNVSVKYLSFFQDNDANKPWSWGAAILAHMYYSLGASSRVNAKGLACCTTLLEVVWDPHLEKREDKHNFKEVASFTVSLTKLCPDIVNLAEDDDYEDGRALGDRGGVSQRENVEVPHSQNEGGGGPVEVVEDLARSVLVESLAAKVCTLTNFLSYSCLVIHILGRELPCNNFVTRLLLLQTSECSFLMEANLRMQADIQAKDVANSICEKKLNEKLNLVPHSEENVVEAEMWKQKYQELNAKYEEAQRRLSERDRNGVWHLALKGAIEGWDFKDTEDPTWEELSRQFTKFLTIA
ncbi:hypothetical protein GIB67_036335 [Kingdonia uniflora]|uniref:Aminotransferase-like plant mobile domain-containing protein n=1 Tax=Kingdonia uniflora TaxID=39325 RepID=A0A7J7L410_9MAGN|nr:hypothetical protein GIB67_036335 [Kingdonia uniflora]